MKRPSKKDIKAAIEKLKAPPENQPQSAPEQKQGKLGSKKSSQRIRKQGV